MLEALKAILDIQELDMQMIQLMRLKKERQAELDKLKNIKEGLQQQSAAKEAEIEEMKKSVRLFEGDLSDTITKFKKLETQQNLIKKVDEFNALNHEMSQVERERVAKEQRLAELKERLSAEEDVLKNLQHTTGVTSDSNKLLESEIHESVSHINQEGSVLKTQRDQLVSTADPEVFRIYERLLKNKKDRVVVPIENRCCSGCHIMLTAQDENMVRKGERLVFCEHCSRIHYWQESEAVEGTAAATKQRRRRATKV